MKKILVFVFLAFLAPNAFAQNNSLKTPPNCVNHVPHGLPQVNQIKGPLICRKAYILLHDNLAKVPNWVSYVITPERAIGCLPRSNSFAPDYGLPRGQRSEMSDFAQSGFDIGHVANNADMSWDPVAQRESDILSNMYPQLPGFNRGIWKILETNIRSWSLSRNTHLTVLSGAVWNQSSKTIGVNRVVVPDAFWKVVIDNQSGKHLAFIFPHLEGLGRNLTKFQTSVSAIELTAGIQIPLPGDKNQILKIWPNFTKELTQTKRKVCNRLTL